MKDFIRNVLTVAILLIYSAIGYKICVSIGQKLKIAEIVVELVRSIKSAVTRKQPTNRITITKKRIIVLYDYSHNTVICIYLLNEL